MSRKQFIESNGATCANWNWSWSFINDGQKTIIFGVWDINDDGSKALVFSEKWEVSRKGRRQPGYPQSREHIRLIEEEGYQLQTFPMKYSSAKEEDCTAPAKIDDFTPKLTSKNLIRVGECWYATNNAVIPRLAEELSRVDTFIEGAVATVSVNKYERNPTARTKCVQHHGYKCSVCSFNFEDFYGPIGKHYIHVHHLVPLSEVKEEHSIDPIKDMVPICPNCHAIVHSTRPALDISQLRDYLNKVRNRT